MNQLPLFVQRGLRTQKAVDRELGKARIKDPETAKAAARSVDATRLESLCLDFLRHSQGLTAHELAQILRLPLVSVSPRMRPLVNKGLVTDSGGRRATASGRKAIVWRANT